LIVYPRKQKWKPECWQLGNTFVCYISKNMIWDGIKLRLEEGPDEVLTVQLIRSFDVFVKYERPAWKHLNSLQHFCWPRSDESCCEFRKGYVNITVPFVEGEVIVDRILWSRSRAMSQLDAGVEFVASCTLPPWNFWEFRDVLLLVPNIEFFVDFGLEEESYGKDVFPGRSEVERPGRVLTVRSS
jgi:hypothetical protein